MKDRLSQIELRLKKVGNSLAAEQAKVANLNRDITTLEKNNADLYRHNTDLVSEKQTLTAKADQARAQYETELNNLQAQISALQQKQAQSDPTSAAELRGRIRALEEDVQEKEALRRNLETTIQGLQEDVRTAQGREETAKDKIGELRGVIIQWRTQHDQLTEGLKTSEQTVNNQQRQIQHLEGQITQLQTDLTQQIANSQTEHEQRLTEAARVTQLQLQKAAWDRERLDFQNLIKLKEGMSRDSRIWSMT